MDIFAKLLEWTSVTPGASIMIEKGSFGPYAVRVRLIVEKKGQPKIVATSDAMYSILEFRVAPIVDPLPLEAAIRNINQAIKDW